jgi:hypothetical protein
MAQTRQQAELPFSCRWIRRLGNGNMRASNWTRALCMRVADAPRVVTRSECARCDYWDVPSMTRRLGAFR